MKTKKEIFLTTLALFLLAAVSLSAGGDKEYWAKLKKDLSLTDAQVTQLQEKFEALHPQGEQLEERMRAIKREMQELERAATPDEKAMREKRDERDRLTKEWKEKKMDIFRSVLSAEQFAKFQDMEARAMKEKKEHSEKKTKD